MSAQQPPLPASQVILTRVDHASRIFYQCDPAPDWPQPAFPIAAAVAEDPFVQQLALLTASNMAGLGNEAYRLFVGYVLAAYHDYQYVHVARTSTLGQEMVQEWEQYHNID
jgi:hypothetical protein